MKAITGKLTRRIDLRIDNEYVRNQIARYDKEHVSSVKKGIDNLETWENGVGAIITLRAKSGSNDIAGSMYLSQDIEWTEE